MAVGYGCIPETVGLQLQVLRPPKLTVGLGLNFQEGKSLVESQGELSWDVQMGKSVYPNL